ncbi:hypothetical protein RUM44_011521 [Polyplax serrata]|uniref:Uncharacterized protein n=1 Tax=Polyplax serrata TaxID=468196 RepID=A0ABR1AQY6_POLSC
MNSFKDGNLVYGEKVKISGLKCILLNCRLGNSALEILAVSTGTREALNFLDKSAKEWKKTQTDSEEVPLVHYLSECVVRMRYITGNSLSVTVLLLILSRHGEELTSSQGCVLM